MDAVDGNITLFNDTSTFGQSRQQRWYDKSMLLDVIRLLDADVNPMTLAKIKNDHKINLLEILLQNINRLIRHWH